MSFRAPEANRKICVSWEGVEKKECVNSTLLSYNSTQTGNPSNISSTTEHYPSSFQKTYKHHGSDPNMGGADGFLLTWSKMPELHCKRIFSILQKERISKACEKISEQPLHPEQSPLPAPRLPAVNPRRHWDAVNTLQQPRRVTGTLTYCFLLAQGSYMKAWWQKIPTLTTGCTVISQPCLIEIAGERI